MIGWIDRRKTIQAVSACFSHSENDEGPCTQDCVYRHLQEPYCRSLMLYEVLNLLLNDSEKEAQGAEW